MTTSKNPVTLRPSTPEDDKFFSAWSKDPEITALDPPTPVLSYNNMLSIEVDGKLIGACYLYSYSWRKIELGIRIGDKDNWDRGYGTHAVNLLTDFAFKNYPVDTVVLKVLLNNDRARECYKKCGYVEYAHIVIDSLHYVQMCINRK